MEAKGLAEEAGVAAGDSAAAVLVEVPKKESSWETGGAGAAGAPEGVDADPRCESSTMPEPAKRSITGIDSLLVILSFFFLSFFFLGLSTGAPAAATGSSLFSSLLSC